MAKLIYGKGIRDLPSQKGGKRIKSYVVWSNMLRRCYDDKSHPTYHDVEVCEHWLTYSNFHNWFEVHGVEGYQLDKDLLGGKIYSPMNCVMIPKKLNVLLAGNYPDKTLAEALECYYDGRISMLTLARIKVYLK